MESDLHEYLRGIDPKKVELTPELMAKLIEIYCGSGDDDLANRPGPNYVDMTPMAKKIFYSILEGVNNDGRALDFFSAINGLDGKINKITGKEFFSPLVSLMTNDDVPIIKFYEAIRDNIYYFGGREEMEKLVKLGEYISASKILGDYYKDRLEDEINTHKASLAVKASAKDGMLQVSAIARIITGIKNGTIDTYNSEHMPVIENAIKFNKDVKFLEMLVKLTGLPESMLTNAKNRLNSLDKQVPNIQTKRILSK